MVRHNDRNEARPTSDARLLIELAGDDGKSREYYTIEGWIGWANQTLLELTATTRHLGAQIDQLRGQLPSSREERAGRGAAQRRIEELEHALAALRARFDALDGRFDDLLGQIDEQAVGQEAAGSARPTEQGMAHHAYADRYKTIRVQGVRGLMANARFDGNPIKVRQRALLTASLCERLFNSAPARPDEVMALLAPGIDVD